MTDNRFILNSAYDLNQMQEADSISSYYHSNAPLQMENVCNRVVILLTMCVNKELSIILANTDVSEKDYFIFLKKTYTEVCLKYQNINKRIITKLEIDISKQKEFLEYLNYFVVCLLSGIKYIEKKKDEKWHQYDEQNEWNTRFRREERVRDYMKGLISNNGKFTKFTLKNKIEIPYMYVLAWDLTPLFKKFFDTYEPYGDNDQSYYGNLCRNTSIELRYISDNLLDILIYGQQTDKERFSETSPDKLLKIYKTITFKKLLPTICFGERVNYNHDLLNPDGDIIAKKTHQLPFIKKEILQSIPLLPMQVDKEIYNPEKSTRMMLDLLKEKNKTKDYLESDILYLKNSIVNFCELLLDWVWETEINFLRIDIAKTEEYFINIIKFAKTLPRNDNPESKETYLKSLLSVIAKIWDTTQLNNIEVIDGKPKTYILYACFSVLKLTRNWNEHNLIHDVSFTFVAFAFIISLRYIFDIDKLCTEMRNNYLYEEEKFFRFFKESPLDYSEYNISEIEKEYKLLYNNVSQSAFYNNHNWAQKKFPETDWPGDPHQVLSTAGYSESLIKEQMTENEIYLTFWLTIHMGKKQNQIIKLSKSTDKNIFILLTDIYEYQKKSFLLSN